MYNGDTSWQAAIELKSLIALPEYSSLWAFQPDMRYYLVEERLHPVETGDSLSGLLFELENCQNPAQLMSVIKRLAVRVSNPGDMELRRAFLQLIKLVLSQKKGIPLKTGDVTELSEVREMLSTRLEQWEEKILEKGIEKGIEKGKTMGGSTLLFHQLERKFGPLPQWTQDKLANADSQTLERWGLAFMDADSLEDVFK